MATVGPTFAGTGASFNDGGTTAWTNPTNAQGDTTATAATCAPGSSIGNTSQRLRLSNFGLSVPTGATVLGITVEVEKQASANNRSKWGTNGCRLLKAGAEVGSDLAAGATWSNSKAFQTLGDAANLWGTTWTPAEVSASGFGVSLKTERTSASAVTDSVFRARITVTFTPPNANGSFAGTGGGVTAESGAKGAQQSLTATASGVVTWSYAVASVENHDGALAATGGGIASTTASAGRSGTFAVTGAGTGAVGITTGRSAGLTITSGEGPDVQTGLSLTGGGVVSLSVVAGRQLAAALSGGGVFATDQASDRLAAFSGTGGGTASVSATQGESHDGTLNGTGGGTLDLEELADRLVSLGLTGGGSFVTGSSSERFAGLTASGSGRARFGYAGPIVDLPDIAYTTEPVGLTVSTSHVDLEEMP